MKGGEEREENDSSRDMYGSDKLESPHVNGDESRVHSSHKDVTKRIHFNHTSMNNSTLIIGNTIHNAVEFIKVVRQYIITREKDLRFKRNENKRVVIVCKDQRCKYRIYGRQLKNEMTFLLVSLRPKHTYTRKYQNHMLTSTWIANWCMDFF